MPTYSANPEYPDLRFAWPKAYGRTRFGRGWGEPLPRLLVVHYTAGSESASSAENGAGYDQIRTDGTSAHFYIDADSIVQCLPTWMRSNTAMRNGNTLGIHYEQCGTIQTRAQWLEPNSRAIIANTARQMARDAAKWKIPIRRLTPAQVAAGQSGICGHVDITHAFPQDNGTHTDPGPGYPWDVLLDDISSAPGIEGDDMTPEQAQQLTNMHDWLYDFCRGLVAADAGTPHIKTYVPNQILTELQQRPGVVLPPIQLSEQDRTAIVADLGAAVGPLVEAAAERAVRKVLGAIDGATPP